MSENTTKIRNIKQYLKAVLFNAPSTIGSYYTSLVAHDMYGGRTISRRSRSLATRLFLQRGRKPVNQPKGGFDYDAENRSFDF